jgi:hypothetical protein
VRGDELTLIAIKEREVSRRALWEGVWSREVDLSAPRRLAAAGSTWGANNVKEGVMELDQLDRMRETDAGISRRRVLRLLGGGMAGGLLALRGVPAAFGAPRCRRPGEECEKEKPCCNGVCCAGVCCPDGQVCQNGRCVSAPPKTNRQICVCADGLVVDNLCVSIDCFSSAQQDAICGPVCASHGGEAATGCVTNDPLCVG